MAWFSRTDEGDRTRKEAAKRLADERKRRKAEERAEKRRLAEIERSRKRAQLFSAQAEEREQLARKRKASRIASQRSTGGYLLGLGEREGRKAGKTARKATRKVAKAATRRRDSGSKISWL